MSGFQSVDVARNQFDSKGLELAIQSMTQNLNNFYSTGTINEIGAIVAYGGTIPPTGFLLCDGSAISRSTFSALFAVLGTTYGVGDGSTTFNLPNLKGRTIFGLDASQSEFTPLGKTGGQKDIMAHTHTLKGVNGASMGNGSAYPGLSDITNRTVVSDTAGTGTNNLNPYGVANWIIRYALPASNTMQNLPSIPYKFSAYLNSAQNSINGFAKINLNSKVFDSSSSFDDVTNKRFVAPVNGFYQFSGGVAMAGTSTPVWQSMLYKNGVQVKIGTLVNSNISYQDSVVTGLLQLNAGDYVELYLYASATVPIVLGLATFLDGFLASV